MWQYSKDCILKDCLQIMSGYSRTTLLAQQAPSTQISNFYYSQYMRQHRTKLQESVK